mmetsp:Transcript_45138/g.145233  ORF Transcript_45138/g.145233 Transcript_45138/m.145233 type:complete len:250 (+) Transcript_45138:67-816(+)
MRDLRLIVLSSLLFFGPTQAAPVGQKQTFRGRAGGTMLTRSINLVIGPGPNWARCTAVDHRKWKTVDMVKEWADYVVYFANFKGLPLPDDSVGAIYASHTMEHTPMHVSPRIFKEFHRVLLPGGFLRVITPNPRVTMQHYLAGDNNFSLFQRRRRIQHSGHNWTPFELLRSDFLSVSHQSDQLGGTGLAHQNAWDAETMIKDFHRAGFRTAYESAYNRSRSGEYSFEGPGGCHSEADQADRSLYVEGRA